VERASGSLRGPRSSGDGAQQVVARAFSGIVDSRLSVVVVAT